MPLDAGDACEVVFARLHARFREPARDGGAGRARTRVAFRLDETNDISCGGQAGINNTFASALWSLNELFQLARAGVDGVNVHTSQRTIGKLFTFNQVDGTWEAQVAPTYYGLLAFAQAAPPGSRFWALAAR